MDGRPIIGEGRHRANPVANDGTVRCVSAGVPAEAGERREPRSWPADADAGERRDNAPGPAAGPVYEPSARDPAARAIATPVTSTSSHPTRTVR
jgi:hypothetical protein